MISPSPEGSILPDAPPRLEALGRRLALGWVLLYTALIVLVSLAPFDRWDFSAFHLGWQFRILQSSLVVHARLHVLRDVVTNFLLYLPLGLLVPWAAVRASAAGDRATPPCLSVPVWTILLGALLSFSMELAQFPTSRYPNYFDLASNSAGHALGWLLIRALIVRYRLSPALLLGRRGATPRARIAAAFRMGYATLLVVLSLMPYNIAVGAEKLWGKLLGESSGHFWLDPLAPWTWERAGMAWRVALLLVPFGFLSLLAHPERGRRALVHYAVLGATLQALIELAQLPVLDRTTDLLQIFSAAAGAGLGVLLATAWDRTTSRSNGDGPTPAQPAAGRWFQPADALFLALLAWMLALMIEAWRPFRFVPMAWDAARKLYREASWVPFRAYLEQERSLGIWKDIGAEVGWWVPLGMLAAAWLMRVGPRLRRRTRFALAMVMVLLWGSLLELGQAMVVTRYVDATDICSHLLGGWIGYALGDLLLGGRGTPPTSPPLPGA